jgi:hypothetical protein
MNPVLIASGFMVESRAENGKLALHYSITHRKIDRANIIMFPIIFISLTGFFFICFLYVTIMGRRLDMIIFELGMAIIIALCFFWAKAGLKKAPLMLP